MWRPVAVAVVAGALSLAGAACGSGGDSKKAEADPHELRAPASEVGAGLGRIDALAGQIGLAVSADTNAAKTQAGGIEALWSPIEGTIRDNDQDTYIRFEDDFAALENATETGDVAKTQSTAADVSAAVKSYLAKFPA
jgi:hypothetical protein